MSLEIIRTLKKCILPNYHNLRLSRSIEGIYYIFLEEYNQQDLLKRKKLLWNGEYESDANVKFNYYKENCDCGQNRKDE